MQMTVPLEGERKTDSHGIRESYWNQRLNDLLDLLSMVLQTYEWL